MTCRREVPAPDERDVVPRLIDAAGPRRPPPSAAADRVREAVHGEWRRRVRARRTRHVLLAAGLPATAVALATAVVMLRDRAPATLHEVSRAASHVATLESVVGARARAIDPATQTWRTLAPSATLAAGTVVETAPETRGSLRLATGTSLRFAGSTRVALLGHSTLRFEQGVIYVDNPGVNGRGRPVTIATPFGRVSDIGTQFELRLDDTTLCVRVREGAVAFDRRERSDLATAGTELRVARNGSMERQRIPVSGRDWAWTLGIAPPMDIEGVRLDAFLAWAAREMGWRVQFAEEELARESADTILHGSIAGLTPDQAVASVLATCGLRHQLQDGILTIHAFARKGR